MTRFLQITFGVLLSMMSVGCCYSHRYYDPMSGAMDERRIGFCFADRDDWHPTPQQGHPGYYGEYNGYGSWDNAGVTDWSQQGYGGMVPTYDPGSDGVPFQQSAPMPMKVDGDNGSSGQQPADAGNGGPSSASFVPQPTTYYPQAVPPGIARQQWRARPVVAH